MIRESMEEQPFQLQKGTILINSKYKVESKIGAGSHSSIHVVSVIKGQKHIARAIKIVNIL